VSYDGRPPNQGHSFDSGVSFQQLKHLIEQTVTQPAKKRRPGRHLAMPPYGGAECALPGKASSVIGSSPSAIDVTYR
jgi:hypothetical protein